MATTTQDRKYQQKTFFGQPRALAHLFGVEMWERFSFYGMQGILTLYLYYSVSRGGLDFNPAAATSIVGAYGGSVYLATILGAWLADRMFGPERTLFGSAIVIMFGHIALALVPGITGVGIGLVLVAVGSGGLKANATSLVGTLYSADDPRRDAGFSLFYLGINIGALMGPLLTGLAQTEMGFHYGFGLAAIGMAIGLTQYAFGRRHLTDPKAHEVPNPLPAAQRGRILGFAAAGAAVVAAVALTGLVTADNLADVVIALTVVAALAYFAVILSSKRISSDERSRVYAFIPLFLASAAFWALYQQQFTVVAIYADKRLDRDLFGWTMPVSWVQSINPVFIIVLAGVFTALWTRLGDRQPPTPLKFAAGTGLMGVAFLLFLPMVGSGSHGAPLLGLAGVLLVFTVAELLLSPVGLSVTTKLAPEAFRTQLVALFFLSIALGTALAGSLATHYTVDNETAYFGVLGLVAVGLGVLLAVISPWVTRLMRGVR